MHIVLEIFFFFLKRKPYKFELIPEPPGRSTTNSFPTLTSSHKIEGWIREKKKVL